MQAAIFDTALGLFGIGWTERGLVRVLLPGLDERICAPGSAERGADGTILRASSPR